MGIIKLSASGKQFQFITDDGEMYVTSSIWAKMLLEGKAHGGMVVLSKYPEKISSTRFPKSEIYDPSGLGRTKVEEGSVTTGNDGFSTKSKDAIIETKMYNVNLKEF
jgi:hypothetical protein